jgi:hypothetical protein
VKNENTIIFVQFNPYLKVPRHLNIKGILQISLLGVALCTDGSAKTSVVLRIIGETGDRCFLVTSTSREIPSKMDEVDTA